MKIILCSIFIISFVSNIFAVQHGLGLKMLTLKRAQLMKKAAIPQYLSSANIEVDHSSEMPPVKSQGSQGSCVAWSVGYYLKTFQEKHEYGSNWDNSTTSGQCSPAFLYNHINGGNDNGSYIGDALKLLDNMGLPTWDDMPYDQNDYKKWPSSDVYIKAMPQRCESYELFYYGNASDTVLASMKDWLNNGHCLIIGITIYQNFYDWTNKTDDDIYNVVSGDNLGGHAMCVCGYSSTKKAFKIINSWGTNWGSNGFVWIHEDLFKDGTVDEAYKSIDKTGYSPTHIVSFNFSHKKRGKVEFTVGKGSTDSPSWSKIFLSKMGGNNTMSSAAFDISEGSSKTPLNEWWLKMRDYGSGVSGKLSSLSLTGGTKTLSGISLPKTIKSGKTVYCDISAITVKRLDIDQKIRDAKNDGWLNEVLDTLTQYFE